MRIVIPVLLFGIALSCGPAFAGDDDDTSAIQQLQNATSGDQTLSQTYGDDGHGESCPDACPTGNTDVPEPPAPTPVDTGNGSDNSGSDSGG